MEIQHKSVLHFFLLASKDLLSILPSSTLCSWRPISLRLLNIGLVEYSQWKVQQGPGSCCEARLRDLFAGSLPDKLHLVSICIFPYYDFSPLS